MKSTSRANLRRRSRFALFLLFARFPNDRMTQNGLGMKALGAVFDSHIRDHPHIWGKGELMSFTGALFELTFEMRCSQ